MGKRLERLAHWRSHLSPSQRRTFQEMLTHRYKRAMGGRLLCLDFSSTRIDEDGGRGIYQLVRDFAALGYLPVFRAHFGFLATMRHERFKQLLLQFPFAVFDDASDLPAEAVFATDDLMSRPTGFAKLIQVRFERRRGSITMPTCGPAGLPSACSHHRGSRLPCTSAQKFCA